MSQINYKLELIKKLIKNKSHLRKLAKELKTNAMTISRKLDQLLKENVVDFSQEGKNKVFFLKKTIEAKTYVRLMENYCLLNTLDVYPELRKIILKLQKDRRIKLAILFGSYAKKLAEKDSDIDIFVESNDLNLKKELNTINSKLNVKIGKFNKDDLLIKEIEKNHVIIKGIEQFYEKTKFFDQIE